MRLWTRHSRSAGGFFDFGVVPMQEVERVEFVRGAESILYGSDAMTSAVQFWTATGDPATSAECGAETQVSAQRSLRGL